MELREFIEKIEAYYGRYPNDVIKVAVAKYVSGLGLPLDLVLSMVIREVTNRYGKTPDVAAIREVVNATRPEINMELIARVPKRPQLTHGEGGYVDRAEAQKFIKDLVRKLAKRRRMDRKAS